MEEEYKYKTPVVYARKSKKGEHIYAFNRNGILGETVGSIIMNVSELRPLLDGSCDWIKISVMPAEDKDEEEVEDEMYHGGMG